MVKANILFSLVFDIRRAWFFKSSRNILDALSTGIAGNIFIFLLIIIILLFCEGPCEFMSTLKGYPLPQLKLLNFMVYG